MSLNWPCLVTFRVVNNCTWKVTLGIKRYAVTASPNFVLDIETGPLSHLLVLEIPHFKVNHSVPAIRVEECRDSSVVDQSNEVLVIIFTQKTDIECHCQ